MSGFDRIALEGPVAYKAAKAYEEHLREADARQNEEREKRIGRVVKFWEDKFETKVHEVYLLEEDGTKLEFCIEGYGANPKVVAHTASSYAGGGRTEHTYFKLRVKRTLFDRFVRRPLYAIWNDAGVLSESTYEEPFFSTPRDLGEALERDWKYLKVRWRGERLSLR